MSQRGGFSPSYGRRYSRHGSTPPDPALALLDEAAVRFDFSQYDDVNDMVDVNGGWGPVVPSFEGDTIEFNAAGLHFAATDPVVVNTDFVLESAGPLIYGPNGLTIVQVARTDAVFDVGATKTGIFYSDMLAAGGPQMTLGWVAAAAEDAYQFLLYDVSPAWDILVDETEATTPSGLASSTIAAGVFIQVVVVDVPGQEARITLVTSDGRFDNTVPLLKLVPDYAGDPRAVDGLQTGGSPYQPDDYTLIEWDGWNRALSDAEVDALVAHFTS